MPIRSPSLRMSLAALGWAALAQGCVWDLDLDTSQPAPPAGPIANDAREAWPDAPTDIPPVTEAQLLEACSLAGGCSAEVMELDVPTRLALVDLCLFDSVFSAERAVPMSGFGRWNERVEYWVSCALSHADDCDALRTCRTERDPSIVCEEGGCRTTIPWEVSCEGSVATLQRADTHWQRDCARSFARCDESSPTGCSDRLPTACPPEEPVENRCDGQVRLGCDRAQQVSYHDCERLGGRCTEPAQSPAGCAYRAAPDAECISDPPAAASCEGSDLAACVNGVRVRLPTELCPSSTQPVP